MKVIKITLFFTLCLCATHCSIGRHDKNERFGKEIMASSSMQDLQRPYISIDTEDAKELDPVIFNRKIKNARYIPLFSEEPIGNADKILFYNDRIYILDAFIQEKIFIFNMEGKLLKLIDDRGQGPKEYVGLADIAIDKLNNELIVNDRLALYILHYDLDGKFLKKEKGFPDFYFSVLDGKMINMLSFGQSYSDDVNYHIVVTKGDSVIRRAFPYFPLQKDQALSRTLIYNSQEELLFTPSASDTVYHLISDSTYSVKYVINHSKSIWKKRNEDLGFNNCIKLIKHDSNTSFGHPIYETDGYACFSIKEGYDDQFIYNRQYIYEKQTRKTYKLMQGPIIKEEIFDIVPGVPVGIYGNYYVGLFDENSLKGYKDMCKQFEEKKITIPIHNPSLSAIFENIKKDIEMESVIVLYEIGNLEETK